MSIDYKKILEEYLLHVTECSGYNYLKYSSSYLSLDSKILLFDMAEELEENLEE